MALAECSSPKWCSAFRKMNESKIALEELQGWTERIGSFTEDAIAPDGKSIGHWEREIYHKGIIQKRLEEPQQLLEDSNLGDRFKDRTFATFDAKNDLEAFKVCSNYANDEKLMERKRNGLILAGGYGSGKTHLSGLLLAEAGEEKYITVSFSAKTVRLDDCKEVYLEILHQCDVALAG